MLAALQAVEQATGFQKGPASHLHRHYQCQLHRLLAQLQQCGRTATRSPSRRQKKSPAFPHLGCPITKRDSPECTLRCPARILGQAWPGREKTEEEAGYDKVSKCQHLFPVGHRRLRPFDPRIVRIPSFHSIFYRTIDNTVIIL
jgi:hypothetical protein